jgi:transposase
MTCVVDHDTGRLVWAAEGRNSETILKFFHALGAERAKELTHVSADGAEWIHTGQSQSTTSGAVHGSLPRSAVGHQRGGQGTPHDVEHPTRRRKVSIHGSG